MCSMPLANPSTLDHRRRVRVLPPAASYVEGLWSPSLSPLLLIRMLKQTLLCSVIMQACARGSFSLRRGLDSI
jgi:hypothetical protein